MALVDHHWLNRAPGLPHLSLLHSFAEDRPESDFQERESRPSCCCEWVSRRLNQRLEEEKAHLQSCGCPGFVYHIRLQRQDPE